MAFEELFDAFDDVGRVVSACRRVHVRDIIKRSKQMWSDRGNAERERGLSRERDVPAALKISHESKNASYTWLWSPENRSLTVRT